MEESSLLYFEAYKSTYGILVKAKSNQLKPLSDQIKLFRTSNGVIETHWLWKITYREKLVIKKEIAKQRKFYFRNIEKPPTASEVSSSDIEDLESNE